VPSKGILARRKWSGEKKARAAKERVAKEETGLAQQANRTVMERNGRGFHR